MKILKMFEKERFFLVQILHVFVNERLMLHVERLVFDFGASSRKKQEVRSKAYEVRSEQKVMRSKMVRQ